MRDLDYFKIKVFKQSRLRTHFKTSFLLLHKQQEMAFDRKICYLTSNIQVAFERLLFDAKYPQL